MRPLTALTIALIAIKPTTAASSRITTTHTGTSAAGPSDSVESDYEYSAVEYNAETHSQHERLDDFVPSDHYTSFENAFLDASEQITDALTPASATKDASAVFFNTGRSISKREQEFTNKLLALRNGDNAISAQHIEPYLNFETLGKVLTWALDFAYGHRKEIRSAINIFADINWRIAKHVIEWTLGDRFFIPGESNWMDLYRLAHALDDEILQIYFPEYRGHYTEEFQFARHLILYMNNGDVLKDAFDWPRLNEAKEFHYVRDARDLRLTLVLTNTDSAIKVALTYAQTRVNDGHGTRTSSFKILLPRRQDAVAMHQQGKLVYDTLYLDVLRNDPEVLKYLEDHGISGRIPWFMNRFLDPKKRFQ